MDTPSAPSPSRRKPGPAPGPATRKYTILLAPDLGEWGKRRPGGLSALVRRLLQEARARAGGSR